ncbi:MAG: winged helix-turn-helix domain-containing protein, partial [Acidobacteriaceae bacterium]|nr:winged helix-turn-helix domain-containing protein [Acidobacteriaceae bacterium]
YMRSIRFAVFELRTDTRELSRGGVRIRLQVKPFQVLEKLIERPGELVTREELRNALWPSGTFVDFESGLNTAINRLRAALGDSAEEPRYIETLPRLGYRFICPIDRTGDVQVVATRPGHEHSVTLSVPLEITSPRGMAPPVWTTMYLWSLAALMASGALLFALLHIDFSRHTPAEYRPISFRAGSIVSARFLSGSRVVYSANLADGYQTFVTALDGSNNYKLPVSGVLAAASNQGDLAIWSKCSTKPGSQLSRSSLTGRVGEVMAENASVADWSSDGRQLAIVRKVGSESLIEFPAGKVIFRSQGWIDSVRVSRRGTEIAFLEHPTRDDDAGHVRLLDCGGRGTILTQDWSSAEGLAWSPSGKEIWFTASKEGSSRSLYAVSRSAKVRKLSNQPLSLRLLDVSNDGHALLAIDDTRMIMKAALSGSEAEISQFDFSHIDDITQDGNVLLFTDSGDAGGQHYSAYVYDQNSHIAKRFGSGRALSLSSDGKQALTVDPQDRTALTITSIDSGKSIRVPGRAFRYQWARFLDNGKLMVGGSYPGQRLTICFQNIADGKLIPIADAPYLDEVAISPDKTKISGRLDGKTQIFDLVTKTVHSVLPQLSTMPVAWSADGRSLYLLSLKDYSYSILKLNIDTNQAICWRTIAPQDAGTFAGLAGFAAAPNSNAYAYSLNLKLSRLYLVDGLT